MKLKEILFAGALVLATPIIANAVTATFGGEVYPIHEVKEGDNLAKIAKRYCMTESEMRDINPAENFRSGDPNLIQPGEEVNYKPNCPKPRAYWGGSSIL